MTSRIHGLVAMAALSLGTATAAEPAPSCEGSPHVVGECFTVHGRLSFYNGSPGFRIWRIGTTRILGIYDPVELRGERPWLPPAVVRALGDDVGNQVYGDFRVCPMSRERPGHMQYVCVADATRLVVQAWKSPSR